MSPRRTLLPTLTLAAGYLLVIRPLLLSWSASGDEADGELAGDDLVEGASGRSTMAVTIDAPSSAVWPWLAQMGCQRGGWYSWDRLDNGGEPSEDRIVPELQSIAAGDRLPATPDGDLWFDVVGADPERALVLRSSIDLMTRRNFDPHGPAPRRFSDGTWAFVLDLKRRAERAPAP
jgi:proline iminopeptidase